MKLWRRTWRGGRAFRLLATDVLVVELILLRHLIRLIKLVFRATSSSSIDCSLCQLLVLSAHFDLDIRVWLISVLFDYFISQPTNHQTPLNKYHHHHLLQHSLRSPNRQFGTINPRPPRWLIDNRCSSPPPTTLSSLEFNEKFPSVLLLSNKNNSTTSGCESILLCVFVHPLQPPTYKLNCIPMRQVDDAKGLFSNFFFYVYCLSINNNLSTQSVLPWRFSPFPSSSTTFTLSVPSSEFHNKSVVDSGGLLLKRASMMQKVHLSTTNEWDSLCK